MKNFIKNFLWLISGAEVHVLKQCPNEKYKYASIGLILIITTIFACFSGTLAGYFFGDKNLIIAITFGLIWGSLVYSIDRMMITSIKKNPNESKQPFWKYFIPRFVLGSLLAFFISIPVELKIFDKQIEKHMLDDKANEVNEYEKKLVSVYNIDEIKSDSIHISKEIKEVDEKLQNEPSGTIYQNLKAKIQENQADYENKKSRYDRKVSERKTIWNRIPTYFDSITKDFIKDTLSLEYQEWCNIKLKINEIDKEVQTKKRILDNLVSKRDSIQFEYYTSNLNEKNKLDSIKKEVENDLSINRDSLKSAKSNYKAEIDDDKSFVRRFVTMQNIEGFWNHFFIWFIRVIFLIIEILPIYTKLISPIGQYDIKLDSDDEEFRSNYSFADELRKESCNIKKEKELEFIKQSEEQRIQKELEFNEQVLIKVAKIQLETVNETLKAWKMNEKKNRIKKEENYN